MYEGCAALHVLHSCCVCCCGLLYSIGFNLLNFGGSLLTMMMMMMMMITMITDGWTNWDFTSFSTVFQSYQDDGRVNMKGSVQ